MKINDHKNGNSHPKTPISIHFFYAHDFYLIVHAIFTPPLYLMQFILSIIMINWYNIGAKVAEDLLTNIFYGPLENERCLNDKSYGINPDHEYRRC